MEGNKPSSNMFTTLTKGLYYSVCSAAANSSISSVFLTNIYLLDLLISPFDFSLHVPRGKPLTILDGKVSLC